MPVIHTIGYQGVSTEELITALRDANVAVLLDIRAAPVSCKAGFSRDALAETLTAAGFTYRHLGALGNPQAGRDAARQGDLARYHTIFQSHLESAPAQAALEQVSALASEQPVCLMCFERQPSDCHRLLVAGRLAATVGFEIRHLFAGQAELPLA